MYRIPYRFLLFSLTVLLGSCSGPLDYYVVSETRPFADSIISAKDYSRYAGHQKPYIVHGLNFTIFGSIHSRDPEHFQIGMMGKEWNKLKPTVALVEGRLGVTVPLFKNPIKSAGEGAKVNQLARGRGVRVYNWDLSKEHLAKKLMKKYKADQIALSQILNPYFGQVRFGKPDSPEDFIEEYIERASYVGLEDSIKTPADVNKIWRKYFPDVNWQDVDDRYPLPGFLGDIAHQNSDARNIQLINAIRELTAKGERVFVVCGNAHAFCVTPTFARSVVVQAEEMIDFLWNDADELNNLAWSYYENKNSDADIRKAIGWIERSIELKSTYENNDTFAWLLYKSGRKEEAMRQAKLAIDIAKANGKKFDETEKLLLILKD